MQVATLEMSGEHFNAELVGIGNGKSLDAILKCPRDDMICARITDNIVQIKYKSLDLRQAISMIHILRFGALLSINYGYGLNRHYIIKKN